MRRTFTLQLYDRIESDPDCTSKLSMGLGAPVIPCSLQQGHKGQHRSNSVSWDQQRCPSYRTSDIPGELVRCALDQDHAGNHVAGHYSWTTVAQSGIVDIMLVDDLSKP